MKFLRIAIAAAALAAIGAPVAAQYVSSSDEFVTAVRDRDGGKATQLIQANPRLIDMRDEKGDTALIVAVSRSDEDYTAFLLSHGADPNVAAKNGDTPLMAAVRDGFEQGAEWLLSKGAKVDATNRMGETALIVAVQQRKVPLVKLLLAAGADPDKTDSAAGLSARDYATRDNRARDIQRAIEAKKPKTAAAPAIR